MSARTGLFRITEFLCRGLPLSVESKSNLSKTLKESVYAQFNKYFVIYHQNSSVLTAKKRLSVHPPQLSYVEMMISVYYRLISDLRYNLLKWTQEAQIPAGFYEEFNRIVMLWIWFLLAVRWWEMRRFYWNFADTVRFSSSFILNIFKFVIQHLVYSIFV